MPTRVLGQCACLLLLVTGMHDAYLGSHTPTNSQTIMISSRGKQCCLERNNRCCVYGACQFMLSPINAEIMAMLGLMKDHRLILESSVTSAFTLVHKPFIPKTLSSVVSFSLLVSEGKPSGVG